MTLRFLILVSLCTLIYSDSLSHFREIATHDFEIVTRQSVSDNILVVHKIIFDEERSPKDSLFDESSESCAKQCLLTKFFCRFFMVMELDGERQCLMGYRRWINLNSYFTIFKFLTPRRTKLIATYDITEKIDNVAIITKDPTLLSEGRFDELLRGYGLSKSLNEEFWDGIVAILKVYAAALYLPKSRPKYFRKWLSGIESSYEHQPMSGLTSKYTDNFEQLRKRPRIVNTPNFSLLMFLDLFSRAADENTETIYDPEEGTLYIHSPDIQLLFVSHDKDDYIWVAFGNRVSTSEVHVGISKSEKRQDILDTVVEDFVKAVHRHNPEVVVQYDEDFVFEFDDHESRLWRLVTFLTGLGYLEAVPDYEDLMYEDLSKVVPILHEKRMMPYTEQLFKSFPKELVDIITQ